VNLIADAPAKINRELRVGGYRPDGYHDIRSRLVSIDLADRIEVSPGDAIEFFCEGLAAPAGESNLVMRAARLLASRLGTRAGARLYLEKRIPVGAGLGGGSSDAARALVLLARLWGARLSTTDLLPLAATLGSDVPFFLFGGEAEVSGRGERVTPLTDSPPEDLLLLVPPFAIPTSDVYAAHRRLFTREGRTMPSPLEIETSGNFFGPNDLALAVLKTRSEMGILLDSARPFASECVITGSGSAIVLRGAAADAGERLAARHPEAAILRCRTLNREEYRFRTDSSGGFQWRSLK